jgi:hypothetical protein
VDEIRKLLGDIKYRDHAAGRMLLRGFTVDDVREALESQRAEIIESDQGRYGRSDLVASWLADGRPIHVLVGVAAILWVITVYDPSVDPKRTFLPPDYRTRRRPTEPQEADGHG